MCQTTIIERREGTVIISVPVPLPSQLVDELNGQDEADNETRVKREAFPPPTLPDPVFHFNQRVSLRVATDSAEMLSVKWTQVDAQMAKKQSNVDQRRASLRALLKERAELQLRLEIQGKDS